MSFPELVLSDGIHVQVPQSIGGYNFVRVISQGSYSVVCLVQSRITRADFACKMVPRAVLAHGSVLELFEREVRIHETIRHPNVVALVEVLYTATLICVVMEYCSSGDLLQMIHMHNFLADADCRRIFYQILLGVQYLHGHHISHRDIKPENIFIDDAGTPKIGDFGLSHHMSQNALLKTACGSLQYCAPEIVQGLEYDGRPVDVWSLGVLLYAMATGRLPWSSSNQLELCEEIVAREIVSLNVSSSALKRLIRWMLNRDPAKRPTVDELLADPWLSSTKNARPSKGFGTSKSMVIETKKDMGQFKVFKRKVILKPQLTSVPGIPINKENLGARREFFRWTHRPENGG
jgi:MAP/microtubule affinity-regulating kinase